jgi:integrase
LTPAQRLDVVSILKEMEAKNLTLREVWQIFQAEKFRAPANRQTIETTIAEYVQAKTQANRRKYYIDGLEAYLRRFAKGREKMGMDQFRASDIDGWFVERKEPPSSRASNFFRISGLFAFAKRRGYIRDNPCDSVERVTVEAKPPAILTIRQVMKSLVWAKRNAPRFLPYLVLALFAGIRPEEIDRLTWKSVNLKRGLVTIEAEGSKIRRRRIVHLEPCAVAWLELGGDLPLPKMSRRRSVRRLRNKLGFKQWPSDVLRHTAASMALAIKKDAAAVALELGNSPSILLKHYREIVDIETAKKFFNIYPKRKAKI